MNRHWQGLMLVLGAAGLSFLLGCADAPSGDSAKNTPPPVPPPVVVQAAPAANAESDAAPVDTNTNTVAAEVGFGEKGHYDSQDYISVVVSSQFRAIESLTLSRIANAMQTYKAINGYYPKTDEVYFKEVIEANGIALPDLPDGQKYGYDPQLAIQEQGQQSLTILKPKQP